MDTPAAISHARLHVTYIVPMVKLVAFLLQARLQLSQQSPLLLLTDECRPHLHLRAEPLHELPARPNDQAAAGAGAQATRVTAAESCSADSSQYGQSRPHPPVRGTGSQSSLRTAVYLQPRFGPVDTGQAAVWGAMLKARCMLGDVVSQR